MLASPHLAGLPWWLLLPAGLAAYAGVCLAAPVHACPKCKGTRTIRRGDPKRGRPVPCPRCNSQGKVVRPGARLVHQFRQMAHREPGRKLPELPKED